MNARATLLAAALAGACVDNAPIAEPSLDRALFVSVAQPVLAARCASPACHGSDRRRLRVYAPGYFRADPSRTHRDEALTDAELDANARSAAAFALDVTDPEASLLVAKPLGRVAHLGGSVFERSDDDCAALLAWLRRGVAP